MALKSAQETNLPHTWHMADDTNLSYSNSNLAELESIVNYTLKMVSDWLMANKVSLNIDRQISVFSTPLKKSRVTL